MSNNFLEKNGKATQQTFYIGGDGKNFATEKEAVLYDASCRLVVAFVDDTQRQLGDLDRHVAKGLAKWILENYNVIEK